MTLEANSKNSKNGQYIMLEEMQIVHLLVKDALHIYDVIVDMETCPPCLQALL